MELEDIYKMYGDQDLSTWSLFHGGYINFGYWANLDIDTDISEKEREQSSRDLYAEVFKVLMLESKDRVLEVGCGLGNGCIQALQEFAPEKIYGLDSSEKQIQRAVKLHKNHVTQSRLQFVNGKAEELPFTPRSVSKLFSVEAMQHFASIDRFIDSAFNVLEHQGVIVIATFFFNRELEKEFTLDAWPNFSKLIDKPINIDSFKKSLVDKGFVSVNISSIGRYVWKGFDRWISQTEFAKTWNRNWLKAYRDGLLDYYIVSGTRP